ncbi:C1 family peptidase [Candidatus Finniella inopinata]|nr:C1 family peptidase [Candidatus Finniella inopinata]
MVFYKTGLALALLLASTSVSFASVEKEADASQQAAAPFHRYNLVRDEERPQTLAKLANLSTLKKTQTFLESLRASTPPASYDMRSVLINPASKPPVTQNDIDTSIYPVYDQGGLGSCTAQVAAGVLQYRQLLDQSLNSTARPSYPVPSKLFIYYNTRSAAGDSVNQDTGASVSDVALAVTNLGAPPETLWPYSDSATAKINFTMKPTDACYSKALENVARGTSAVSIPRGSNVVKTFQELLSNNCPILIGVAIYSSFESAEATKTGKVPIPNTSKETLFGGHCLMVVGYNDKYAPGTFTVRNSWGSSYTVGDERRPIGNNGYYYIPYDYIANPNLAFDFWTITAYSGENRIVIPV